MDFEVVNTETSVLNNVNPTIIKVIGCGGCGGNAVNCMIDANIQGVDFIALNTDLQALSRSKAPYKLQIGQKISAGLGAGGRPEVGEEAAREEEEAIRNILQDADMVFITAGMGGGTGTGSAPIVSHIARELGALTVAVVTTPFNFEGKIRMRQAEEGIKKLRQEVDSLIVIPNQQIFKEMDKKLSVPQAFRVIDDILRQGVQGISDIITKPGLVNRDFNDVESVMKGQGDAILGVGIGEGENKAIDAATNAINNKLLENTHIDGAKNILINICGNEEVGIAECDEIASIVTASANPDARVLWGQVLDNSMNDTISVTVIATGFNSPNAEPTLEEMEALAASQNDLVPEVKAEPVKDTNTYSNDEFQNLLNPKASEVLHELPRVEEPVEEPVMETQVAQTRESINVNRESFINPTNYGDMRVRGGIDLNDINTPAVLRNKNGLSRTINFNRK